MINKQFAERLNQELDKMELPKPLDERVDAFSKLLHVPRFKAETILEGYIPIEPALVEKIAQELEVDVGWLTAKDTHSS